VARLPLDLEGYVLLVGLANDPLPYSSLHELVKFIADIDMDKTTMYRRLRYLRRAGLVRYDRRMGDFHKQVWFFGLTDEGKAVCLEWSRILETLAQAGIHFLDKEEETVDG